MTQKVLSICIAMILCGSALPQKTRSFQKFHEDLKSNLSEKDFNGGLSQLQNNDHFERSRHRLIYFMEMGSILHHQGKFEESNYWFHRADFYMEDYRKKVGEVMLSSFTNPYGTSYAGEDFEGLYINYYKALNYISMQQLNEALVEVRRMDILLQELRLLYPENKFDKDAFIHLFMGLIYDVNEDYNNAFIAFRNAYNIYQEEYLHEYQISCPDQLLHDLVRTARRSGLREESEFFKSRMPNPVEEISDSLHSIVVLWHNGKAPIKVEESIQFSVSNSGGFLTFIDRSNNEEYKFAEGALKTMALASMINDNGISSYKMSFSTLQEQKPDFDGAVLCNANRGEYKKLELCENINSIAIQSHQDKKTRELSRALVRLAIRQSLKSIGKTSIEQGFKHASDYSWIGEIAGTIFELAFDGLSNSIEKADLRQWYSLPHSIYYARIYYRDEDETLGFEAHGKKSVYYEFSPSELTKGLTLIRLNEK